MAYTNLLLQSCNVGTGASPWANPSHYSAIVAAASIIPGQTAWEHTYASGAGYRRQSVGTFPSPATPHTVVAVFSRGTAASSSVRIWDGSVGIVSGVRYTWATGAASSIGSTYGTDVSYGAVDLGNDVVLLWTTATPVNTGTSREVFATPCGAFTASVGDTAIIHATGLYEAATYPSILIPTAAASVTWNEDYLRIGSTACPVRDGSPTMSEFAVGNLSRAYSGKLLCSVRRVRWDWQVETPWLPLADALAIEAAAKATNPVTVEHAFTGSLYKGAAYIVGIQRTGHRKFSGGERIALRFGIQEAA